MKKPWWIDGGVIPLADILVNIVLVVELILFAINDKPIHFQWAVLLALLLLRQEVKK